MRISTKGRYGTRAMLTLAIRYDEGPVCASDIAQHQEISQKYLENLLASLKSAGLVLAERGKKGGYSLARPPAEITLFDILVPLEDSLGYVHCTDGDEGCERLDTCVTRLVWKELRETTERILKKTTLDDLRRRQKTLVRKAGRVGAAGKSGSQVVTGHRA